MTDNIKVAVRVRPLIARETEQNEKKLWKVKDGTSVSQISSPSEVFCFDRVFDPKEDNFQVYNDLCLPIVKSVMQGFNGTVFAYGQTASGKSFTMMGEHKGIHKGIVQFAIKDIFSIIQEMPEREFLLRVSLLEIYNERVYDLLSEKNDDLKVLEDSYGNIKVNGLKEQIVQTEEQIWQWMHKGLKKRRTAETQMNQLSSRSHFVFRMIIESRLRDEDAAGVNVSQLNLVDLAGSENLKQTNTKGERFKEGVHINLSLSTLIQVISQLSEREDQFINYRNSKLTRLLQNSLGGNALTAIICAITPTSMKETVSTLTFAQRAKKIKNKPKKNEIMTDQALLKQYANQIKKLSQELQVSKEQGKELEEKTKQNEKLKQQIEALKANFVSQAVISKSSRRETWGGRFDARHLRLESFAAGYPSQLTFNLPTLEEEPEGDKSDINMISTPSVRASVSKSISDAEIQTELAYDVLPGFADIDYKGCMTLVSELKTQLTTLQCKYMELETFTTLEKQYLKAESELQTDNEVLRNENSVLRERLNSVLNNIPAKSNLDSSSSEKFDFELIHEISKTAVFCSNRKEFSQKECQTSPLKFDTSSKHEKNSEFGQDLAQNIIDLEVSHCAQINTLEAKIELAYSELKTQQLMVTELEAKYEKESYEMKQQLEKAQNLLQEKNNELEKCNFRQEIIDLEASHSLQIEELEAKLELSQSELNKKSLLIKGLEAKYITDSAKDTEDYELGGMKHLKEKTDELEQCNKNLRQKISDLEDSHSVQIKALEAKLKLAQSELETQLLRIQELEAKYKKETSEMKHKSEETQSRGLQEKNNELEECSRDFRQKMIDLEASHCLQIEALEAKLELSQSELNTKSLVIKELEAICIKESVKCTENHELCNMKHFQGKVDELEQCNRNLRQKISDLEAYYFSEIQAAETKFENAQFKLQLTIKDLEALEKKLTAVKNELKENEYQKLTLQAKCTAAETSYSELKQEIADLKASHCTKLKELEENFETERSEYHEMALKLVNNVEIKYYEQEQQTTDRLKGAYLKRMEVYIKEACELKEEMKNIKTQCQELINDKQHHLKLIKELQDQVESESLEKVNLVLEVRQQSQRDLLASKEKYESIINEYKKKQRQCKDINRQLTVQVRHYREEIEKIKKENQSGSDSLQHLNDNINDLTYERDSLLRKYSAAKRKISDLEKHQKENHSQKKFIKNACRCKDLEESNKFLQFDLNQTKAKIISLETNNANMIEEIKKLKGELSSVVVSCKCKMNSKGSDSDILRNIKENLVKGILEQKSDAVVEESHFIKPESFDADLHEKNSTPTQSIKDQSDLYLIGGGSGPANMVKCYWLEGMLYQKDKEIMKLKQENAELNSELTTVKTHPRLLSKSKPELKRPEVMRSPVSPFQKSNSEITFQTSKTPLQQCSNAFPRIVEKQALKDKYRRKSIKPYEHPPKVVGKKELEGELESLEMKENNQNHQKNNALDMLYSETPGCTQQ